MRQKISERDKCGSATFSAACIRCAKGSNCFFKSTSTSGLGSERHRPKSFEKAVPPLEALREECTAGRMNASRIASSLGPLLPADFSTMSSAASRASFTGTTRNSGNQLLLAPEMIVDGSKVYLGC